VIRFLKMTGLIFLFLAIYYVSQVLSSMIFGLAYGIRIGIESAKTGTMENSSNITEELTSFISGNMSLILVLAILLSLILYYIVFKIKKTSIKDYFLSSRISVKNLIVIFILGISLNITIGYILSFISEISVLKGLFDKYDMVSKQIFGGDNFILTFLVIGLIVPVFEEILFRGLVFGELKKSLSKYVALVLQAVVFGVYHMNVVQGIYACLIGLLIGFVYLKSKSIFGAILLHISINATAVVFSQTHVQNFVEKNSIFYLIISLLLSVVMLTMFVKDKQNEKYIPI